ncbi:hypothetical protein VTH06DRAFT_4766, partial [Thermothelomyces fergusii]
MAPSRTDHDGASRPCCCSREERVRDPASPASLFRIDMHTHMMPPSLPDFSSFSSSSCSGPSPSPPSTARTTTTTTEYVWPAVRPAADHAETGAVDMYVGGAFFRRVDRTCYDAAAREAAMDAAGVDVQVLSTVPALFCYDAPADDAADAARALALARALNDHLASVCAARPRRFVALGTVPLQHPASAVDELRRLMRLPGMVGVQVGTSVERFPTTTTTTTTTTAAAATAARTEGGAPLLMLDDERLDGFWSACEELEAAVFVHPLGYALTRENPAAGALRGARWLVG